MARQNFTQQERQKVKPLVKNGGNIRHTIVTPKLNKEQLVKSRLIPKISSLASVYEIQINFDKLFRNFVPRQVK